MKDRSNKNSTNRSPDYSFLSYVISAVIAWATFALGTEALIMLRCNSPSCASSSYASGMRLNLSAVGGGGIALLGLLLAPLIVSYRAAGEYRQRSKEETVRSEIVTGAKWRLILGLLPILVLAFAL